MSTDAEYADLDAFLNGKGSKAIKWPNVGDVREGKIIDPKPVLKQCINPKNKEKEFWPKSGDPKMQMIVNLQTSLRDPEDPEDTGVRRMFIKGGLLTAVQEAVDKADAPGLRVGGYIKAERIADGVAENGMSAPHLFKVEYRTPADVAAGGVPNPAQVSAPTTPQVTLPEGVDTAGALAALQALLGGQK